MSRNNLQDTKRLMGALVRMKPKAHEDMKVGKQPKPDRPSKPSNTGTSKTKPSR